jgi:amino acid adenylation domain-containing protein
MSSEEPRLENAVAIIGMAGRFPEAATLEQFWDNLRHGVESVRRIPEADLLAAGVSLATLRDPSYVPVAGVLGEVDLFDAPFFGFSAREAALLDPQHRLLLEAAWEALEDAGYDAERIAGPVGVYVGASVNSYFLHYLFSPREQLNSPDGAQYFVGNDNNFLATRTSYKLGLRGPSLTIQTACSTSLVAVHLACQSLLNGECDMAIAGGVSVRVPQVGYFYRPGGILAPDGHCRAFDAQAGGSVMGSGLGVVVLKRIEDALADGDPIRAVILGSAINNDGALRIGYTAPSAQGQEAAIAEALALARVEPGTVSYVEAHGSGTPLGDPIELTALARAFGDGVAPGSCAVGSVKTNIGHLDAAAGVAGLIKTVLALEHGEIPPSLHFTTPNPQIALASSPFYVSSGLRSWTMDGAAPRRAGVSSFGMGGTNAHVVLEEAPRPGPSEPSSRPWQLLVLSAATPAALDAATPNLAAHLEAHPGEPLADVAYTLQLGRKVMRHRRAVVISEGENAADVLGRREPGRLLEGAEDRTDRSVAFLLPGLGDSHPGMGRGLYEGEPVFREAVDRCCRILEPYLGRDLRQLLYPADAPARGLDFKALVGRSEEAIGSDLDRTAFAQPAMFVTEYALAQLWKEWGVEPAALLGYSLGEYTAACLAGVFSMEDALRVVALRAQLIERLPAGMMLAVPLAESAVLPLLDENLSISAVNGPELCVVGGPAEAVQALEARLASQGLTTRRIRTSHAFHSRMMQPAAGELLRLLADVPLQAPEIPFLSNVTGTWITAAEATDPAYWVRHLLAPVRLDAGLTELWKGTDRLLLEIGPGASLSSLALQHPAAAGGSRIAVPSLPGAHEARPEPAFALGVLGRLWLGGARLDWTRLWEGERRRRLRLPTYPFERSRYWVEDRPEIVEVPAVGIAVPPEPAQAGSTVTTTRHSRPPLPTPFAAPLGAVEEALAATWQELLGVEPIGRDDSFFDLGGHSLMAAQLMARLAESFAAELPVAALFESPTIALLAQEVETASGESVELAGTSLPPLPPITPVPRPADGSGLPLSFAQERLWFLDRMVPENAVYNVPLMLRLEGRLLLPALAASLNEIAARHEILRTTFTAIDDTPRQVAASALRLDPPVIDLGGLPREGRESEARRQLDAEMARPFDLAAGPLARALLVRLEAEHHLALFNLHHIVSDGWSLGLLTHELGALYHAFAAGEPSPLPALPVQYADYAVWQRQWLQGERLDEQIDYWRRRLAGAPAELALPHDRPRPPLQRFQGAKHVVRLGWDEFPALGAVQRASQVTLFMVLLAAYETLLSRLSGQDDLVVGSPVAGRGRRETEGLMGFFVNTLALRGDLSGDPTFTELLARVRQVTLEAYARESVPFERLVEELQPERSLSRSPIYQAVLVLLNAPSSALELPGLKMDMIESWVPGAKWDLTVSLEERAEGLAGYWEYDSDLFDATTVARFLGHFRQLLATAVAEPERRLSDLPLLTAAERQALLAEWTDTRVERPLGNLCLHELVEAQAARTPENLAIVSEDGDLTYRELLERSGALADHLESLGVGPETVVGLFAERTPELVVGVLGVLRAGAAWLPLDPAYPPERLSQMLEDSGAGVLLTQRRLEGFLADWPARPKTLLFLEELPRTAPARPVRARVTPDNLAYVIYTSGSTGRPKGVAVPHRGVVNRLLEAHERFGITAADSILQRASIGFDASVWEMLSPLVAGGRVVLAKPGGHQDPAYMVRTLAERGVSIVHFVPSVLEILVAEPGFERCDGMLRLMISGGEALSGALRDRFSSLLPRTVLANVYGPTEASIDLLWHLCAKGEEGLSVPIGRPITGCTALVLDAALNPVPAGVAGELYLGGVCLVRGYLGRPDLTAERFVPAPFGDRLYRTGDLARFRADGELEYLGRTDQQVKIRGIRIELGEIESVLASHAGVTQAAVVAREEGGERRLVAFVVGDETATADELRALARRRLPEAMVPSHFVFLDALPLSPAGKIDRRALAARPVERPAAASYKPPGNELEHQIAEIWQEVLKVERVGMDDNFFDLGGHSLALVQVQRRIKALLAREISVIDLFRTPTVAALTRYLSGPEAESATMASAEAAHEGDERARTRRALRDRRRQLASAEDRSPVEEIEEEALR